MPITFQHATLPNGLTIIAETDPAAHTAALGFFVRTGARDEDPAVMGVSHFLEHMMFKGTPTRTAEDVDRDFDNIGADHNAFTTSELTAFYAHSLPEHFDRAEEVLADILRPALRVEDFDEEKSVILEEIAMYQDQPFWVLYEQAMERYYGSHPLAHRVLGTSDTITALTQPQMAAYFHNRYSADNTVVAAAGRVDFNRLVDAINKHCGHWQTTKAMRPLTSHQPAAQEFTIHSSKVNRHYGLMIAPAPGLNDDRRYAAGMLAMILGEPEGSRLYWALVETGLAEEVAAAYDGRDGIGEYMVYYVCSPEDAHTVEATVKAQIAELVASLTEDDLQRVRSKVATSATLQGERPAGRMRRLGQIWTYAREYRSLESELAKINAVTLDDLRQVFAEFPFTPLLVGRLENRES